MDLPTIQPATIEFDFFEHPQTEPVVDEGATGSRPRPACYILPQPFTIALPAIYVRADDSLPCDTGCGFTQRLSTVAVHGRRVPAKYVRRLEMTTDVFMPRFHFNVYDGISAPDPEGAELATWQEARMEAIRYAGEILQNDAKRVALGEDWHMEVTDDSGLVLFRLDFNVLESAATMDKHPKPREPSDAAQGRRRREP